MTSPKSKKRQQSKAAAERGRSEFGQVRRRAAGQDSTIQWSRLANTAKLKIALASICAILVLLVPHRSEAQMLEPGVSESSYGRFADWPRHGGIYVYLEEDLVKRVFPHAIQKSHAGLDADEWTIGYGWAPLGFEDLDLVTDTGTAELTNPLVQPGDIATTFVNWVRKSFLVTRRLDSGAPVGEGAAYVCAQNDTLTGTYEVTVSSAAPGTWIRSSLGRFYVKYSGAIDWDPAASGFDSLTYYSSAAATLATVSLANYDPTVLATDWDDGDPLHNWVILTGPQNAQATGSANVTIPLLITVPPGRVVGTDVVAIGNDRYFTVDLDTLGGDNTVALSLPMGAYDATPMNPRDPARLGHYELVNRMVCNHPAQIDEQYSENPVAGIVEIHNTVTQMQLSPECATFAWIPYPPLVSKSNLLGGTNPTSESSIYLTKYGLPLMYESGQLDLTYEIPAAPRHDVHVVRHLANTEAQRLADRMIDVVASELRSHKTDIFSVMGNRGTGYALGLASGGTRERYLKRAKSLIGNLLDADAVGVKNVMSPDEIRYPDFSDGELPKLEYTRRSGLARQAVMPVDPCASTPAAAPDSLLGGLWRDYIGGAPLTFDFDAVAGSILEYVYEYLLWSGDVAGMQPLWDGIGAVRLADLQTALQVTHDWASMSSSSWLHTGAGSRTDMLNAQYAGLLAYARIAEIYDDQSEASRARYLAAKVQYPHALRYLAMNWIEDHYKTLPSSEGHQVVVGFGESELTGPLAGSNIFREENWADWSISGERLHPMALELTERSLPAIEWSSRLARFQAEKFPSRISGMLNATFPEVKIFAFALNRQYLSAEDLWEDVEEVQRIYAIADHGWDIAFNYEASRNADGNRAWYEGGFNLGSHPAVHVERGPFPAYAGLLERQTSQLSIGGWGDAHLIDAYVDGGVLHAEFERGGVAWLQSDAFVDSTAGWNGKWGIVEWNVSPGIANTFPLPVGVGQGSPVLAQEPSRPISNPSFGGHGDGDSNIEHGWSDNSAEDRVYKAEVVDPGDDLGNGRALHLVGTAPGQFPSAAQYAFLGDLSAPMATNIPFTLRFRYKVTSPATELTVNLEDYDDGSCFKAGSVIPVGGVECLDIDIQSDRAKAQYATLVNAHPSWPRDEPYYVSSKQMAMEVGTEWRPVEVRGLWNPHGGATTQSGLVRIQFVASSIDAAAGPFEAWIDDVVIELSPSVEALGFGGFRYPRGGQAISLGEADSVISFVLESDERVPRYVDRSASPLVARDAVLDTTSTPLNLPGEGETLVSFEWYDSVAETPTWREIPPRRIRSAYDTGGWSTWLASNSFRWVFDPEDPLLQNYDGWTRLKVKYWQEGTPDPVLVGEVESDVFFMEHTGLQLVDQSAGSGFDFAGKTPYTLLEIDVDTGPGEDNSGSDVVVSMVGSLSRAELYVNATNAVSAPGTAFFQRELLPVDTSTELPTNARGASRGRIDPHIDQMLWVSVPTGQSELYALDGFGLSTTATVGGQQLSTASLLPTTGDDSDPRHFVWSASWGQVNARTALYLARADGVQAADGSGIPTPLEIDGHGRPDQLLRWSRTQQKFIDVTSQALPYSGVSETISASWLDVNGDRRQDIFVSHLGAYNGAGLPGWSALYCSNADGTFTDRSVSGGATPMDMPTPTVPIEDPEGQNSGGGTVLPPLIHQYANVGSIRWVDFDGDQDLDLALAFRSDPGPDMYSVAVLLYEEGEGFTTRANWAPQSHTLMRDIAFGDLDGNGVIDLIGAPADASSSQVPIYLGFEDGGTRFYADRSGQLSVADGVAQTALLHDLDGDGDTDLLLGRGQEFYYANATAIPNALTISLDANESGNPEQGLGALVSLNSSAMPTGTRQWRLIDGTSGRGSQATVAATLGTRSASMADVTVHWPDGYEQSVSVDTATPKTTVVYDAAPAIVPGSVGASVAMNGDNSEFTFTWTTVRSAGSHEVWIWDVNTGNPGLCSVVPSGERNLVVHQDDFGASCTTYADENGFHHTFTWRKICTAPCSYKFEVKSRSGSQLSSSARFNISSPVCGFIQW